MEYETLIHHLRYETDTGNFYWLNPTSKNIKVGTKAGTQHNKGYWQIRLNGKRYLAHVLAWFYVTGSKPDRIVDHINTVKNDNRWLNLRLASKSENNTNKNRMSNNTSGYKGVSFHKRRNKFFAYIKENGKQKSLGYFEKPEDAYEVYCEAARRICKEFANLG